MKRLALTFALLGIALTPSLADEWSQWRGANRDGVAVDAKLPAILPAKLPEPLWKAYVGEGYSSPVIAKGKVFIMGNEGNKVETCLSFDANTGKQLWRKPHDCAFEPPDARAGKGPNSTPTVDRDRVYMLGLGGHFSCIEIKSGNILWTRDLNSEFWGVERGADGEDKWFPVCGASASPLVDGNNVILPVGGKKAGCIVAFDRRTGKIVWKALEERSSYASPLFANLAGQRQLVGFTGLRMVGLDDSEHKLLWEHPLAAFMEQTIVSPVIWKDNVLIGCDAKPIVCLNLSKEDDKIKTKVAWQNADLSAYMVTPIAVKDHLFGMDQRSGRLVCVDLATGKTKWTSTKLIGGLGYVSLVVASNRIFALTTSGELNVFEVNTEKCVPLVTWKPAGEGFNWAHLTITGSRLYVKDKTNLYCYELGK